MTTKSWTLEVLDDPVNGDTILEFPADLMQATGWKEGDTLEWIDLGNGSWQLKKKDKDVTVKEIDEEELAWRALEEKQSTKDA